MNVAGGVQLAQARLALNDVIQQDVAQHTNGVTVFVQLPQHIADATQDRLVIVQIAGIAQVDRKVRKGGVCGREKCKTVQIGNSIGQAGDVERGVQQRKLVV